jgi:hypothetical protein
MIMIITMMTMIVTIMTMIHNNNDDDDNDNNAMLSCDVFCNNIININNDNDVIRFISPH